MNVGRPSEARPTGVQRQAKPSRPSRQPAAPDPGGRRQRQAPALHRRVQAAHSGRGRCRRAKPGAIGALLRREGLYSSHLVTWRRERQAGILKGLTPHKRGPKSKRNPVRKRNQKLRRENQRLTEELRKAEIVIDVQKKVGALLGWPLPKADPEEKP